MSVDIPELYSFIRPNEYSIYYTLSVLFLKQNPKIKLLDSNEMKICQFTFIILLFLLGTVGCVEEPEFSVNLDSSDTNLKSIRDAKKATGSVEIIWKGGKKGNDIGGSITSQPEDLRAFFEFDAHEATEYSKAKGNVLFLVTDQNLTVHREIEASVIDVKVDSEQSKGWFYAKVTSDSKGCNGGETGGHETGCVDGDDHADGGCEDDATHDDGCSHDLTDDGGCTDDHSEVDTCSDGQTDENVGDHGTPGGTGMGNPLKGKNCRIGQFILVKVHDLSSPGRLEDGLAWKWYGPETEFNLSVEPKKLCKKTIVEGNLYIHN